MALSPKSSSFCPHRHSAKSRTPSEHVSRVNVLRGILEASDEELLRHRVSSLCGDCHSLLTDLCEECIANSKLELRCLESVEAAVAPPHFAVDAGCVDLLRARVGELERTVHARGLEQQSLDEQLTTILQEQDEELRRINQLMEELSVTRSAIQVVGKTMHTSALEIGRIESAITQTINPALFNLTRCPTGPLRINGFRLAPLPGVLGGCHDLDVTELMSAWYVLVELLTILRSSGKLKDSIELPEPAALRLPMAEYVKVVRISVLPTRPAAVVIAALGRAVSNSSSSSAGVKQPRDSRFVSSWDNNKYKYVPSQDVKSRLLLLQYTASAAEDFVYSVVAVAVLLVVTMKQLGRQDLLTPDMEAVPSYKPVDCSYLLGVTVADKGRVISATSKLIRLVASMSQALSRLMQTPGRKSSS